MHVSQCLCVVQQAMELHASAHACRGGLGPPCDDVKARMSAEFTAYVCTAFEKQQTRILKIFIGEDRDLPIRDPQIVSLLSLVKAILQRASKWGSLSFPVVKREEQPQDEEPQEELKPKAKSKAKT